MTSENDSNNYVVFWIVNAVLVALLAAAIILSSLGVITWQNGSAVRTYGLKYDAASGELDFSGMSAEEALEKAEDAAKIKGAKSVKLDISGWTVKQLLQFHSTCPELKVGGKIDLDKEDAQDFLALRSAMPDIELSGTVTAGGVVFPLSGGSLDLSEMSADGFPVLMALTDGITEYGSVDFGTEEGGHSRLSDVYAFMQANPETEVSYGFSAFGKSIDIHDRILDLNHIAMSDQGAEVREIIACMPDLTYLDMDFCEVDNDHMAAIREDFPNITVDWRIWFGDRFTARTDETRILASASWLGGELTPENTKGLKYCTKMKYLDIGHMNYLKDISFTAYMPDLEVLIIMMGNVTDISPLANCKHLEFLEIFTNDITDLSPLAELHELKHLNICYNKNLSDMTPLYGLTQLERLWIGRYTQIPKEQIQHFKELAPNCEVNTTCGNPHYNWRWYGDPEDDEPKDFTPRYRLLMRQLGYIGKKYSMPWNDPKYYPHD